MGSATEHLFKQQIPGVRSADQKRSGILQHKFVQAGQQVLFETRLDDLSIPSLARAAG